MRVPFRSSRTPPTSRPTLVLFALAVILPGLVLSALGLVTLNQDRSLADQQIRERRDLLGDRAAAALETALRGWTSALAASPPDSSANSAALPPSIPTAPERSDSAAIVAVGPAGVRTWPAGRLLYNVGEAVASAPLSRPLAPGLIAAERLEFEHRNLPGAAAAYRALLGAADSRMRAEVLVRLGRTYRKAGREDLAASAYRDLERLAGTTVEGVPVELLASCALCAAAPAAERDACALPIYRDLVNGRWRLDRTWYWAYSEQLRGLLNGGAGKLADVEVLAAREADKRSLTRAAEIVVSEARAGAATASSRILTIDGQSSLVLSNGSPNDLHALVLSSSVLADYVWPTVFAPIVGDCAVTLADASGQRLFTSSGDRPEPPSVSEAGAAASRLVHHAGLTLKVDIQLRHPDQLLSGYRLRQWLYLAMLLVMVASLVAGTMLTLRTVSRELAVARLKSQFVSAVSHEFRTPLTGIRHYGEMLLHDRVATEERKHHYYAQVVAAAERLSRLVEDVLDFARMEEGRQEYQFESVETTAWLRHTVDEFQATLGPDKRLEAAVPAALSGIRGDASALSRAVHNLLDNAVKYSPGCDTVWLDARQDDAGLIVSVRDHGVGIPAGDQPHIFDRFFRGQAGTSSTKGTGLGLSLVQHIVSAHGGTIDVASEPGHGTTVTVRIPRSTDSVEK